MVSPDEHQEPQTEPSPPAAPPGSGRRRRRGRRGGRGRSRGPRHPAPTPQAGQPTAETPAAPELETRSHAEGRKDSSAINRAVEEVQQIVESLEQVLEQMEEVRELVEQVQRQKSADERDIESLRRALRRVHQPRSSRPEPTEQAE